MKYRKIPVSVDVLRLLRTVDSFTEVADWTYIGNKNSRISSDEAQEKWYLQTVDILEKEDGIEINNSSGWVLAEWDDYIVKDIDGGFYPCRPDMFEKLYEKVEEK